MMLFLHTARYKCSLFAGVVSVAAGEFHSMILKQDGSVWATGYNTQGQLGDGSTSLKQGFVKVISDGVHVVAAGGFHSMILKDDGSIWATGSNADGQFGDGSTTSQTSFVKLELFGNGKGWTTSMHTLCELVLISISMYCTSKSPS